MYKYQNALKLIVIYVSLSLFYLFFPVLLAVFRNRHAFMSKSRPQYALFVYLMDKSDGQNQNIDTLPMRNLENLLLDRKFT